MRLVGAFVESVAQARHGTLLIDGIEALTIAMATAAAAVLETDITNGSPRLMTTTGADPFQRVRSETLGSDLFYRLNIIRLIIPALREHPEDVSILLEHYLSSFANANTPRLSAAALQRLAEYA